MFGASGTSGPSSGGFFGTAGSNNNDKPGGLGPNIFGQSQSSGFSFGQPPAANNEKKDGGTPGSNAFGSGGGIFGQTPSSNAGGNSDNQKPAGSIFGSAGGAGSTSTPSIFGQSPSTGNDGKSIFGQQPASTGTGGAGIFGKPASTAKPAGGFFNTPTTSSQAPGTPSQSSAPKLNFGSTTPAPVGNPSFFGGSSTTPAGQPPTLMFGASTGGASSQAQAQPSTQAPSFGQTPTSTSGTKPSIFGAAGTPSLFGAKPSETTTQSTPASFGGGFKLGQPSDKPAEPTTKPEVPKFSFAQTTNTSSNQAAPSMFGAPKPSENASSSTPAQAAASTPPSFSFQTTSSSSSQGQTATSKPPAFSGFNLGTSSADKPPLFQKPVTTTQPTEQPKQPGPMFPSLGTSQSATETPQPATTAPAPTPSLFTGFGKPPASSAATTSAASTAPTASSSGPSMFGATSAAGVQTSSKTTAPTTAATTAPANLTFGTSTSAALGKSTMGASTAGPVAPAQSRLRNRTMDEILTRWASDLTRYTKEFKGHAEQVAYWDQIIVDNSAKIDKLYVKTRTCEKQTMSVEMQLSAVENQQNELESWLGKYEGDVEEMLAKDGSGQNEPGGPDQERERTYQLAEKLGERLDDMGRDLQSMIEEVNAANAGLGKSSKADEPITQIVKILNAHLSQLQAIDQGTAALQAKVSAAQKAASGMNYLNASMNGDNRGAVDDFYRSYMGRR